MDSRSTPALPKGRILFADYAVIKFKKVSDLLRKEGFEVDGVNGQQLLLDRLAAQDFSVCVVNLLLGGMGPFEMIRNMRTLSKNKNVKIVVVSRQVHKVNIQNTMQAGGDDFVAEPIESENLFERILYHVAPKQILDPKGIEEKGIDKGEEGRYVNFLLETSELLARTDRTGEHEAFFEILVKASRLVKSNRTSLIIVESDTQTGLVVASSDDADFKDFQINLRKYPEIQHVVHSGQFVLIEDVTNSTLTSKLKSEVKSISIGSLMVFPVRYQGDVIGVMTMRRAKTHNLPKMEELRILQAVANLMATHINIRATLRKIYNSFNSSKAS